MKFSSFGHRNIKADSLREAGKIFAQVKANRLGAKGVVGCCTLNSWNNQSANFQAFIGTYDSDSQSIVGHNEYFDVEVVS